MKVSLKTDTLAYQFGVRPSVLCRDMTKIEVPSVVNSLNFFMKSNSVKDLMAPSTCIKYEMKGNPEVDALMFYMMNHAVSVIRQKKHPYEPLGDLLPIVEEYHNVLAVRGARMFFYLLLICTRESRHSKDSYTGELWKNLVAKYGAGCKSFHQSIKGNGSAAEVFKTAPPKVSLGTYTAFMTDLFNKGLYSGGFGGPAWGAVAKTLRDYVNGTLSAEMMLDTSFTLCHNNGPIFNKGMLFDSYSHHIYKILDVQRSGQIPQLVGNAETEHSTNQELSKVWNLCHATLGNVFAGHVDWFLVEELGALHQYSNEKKAQTQEHGYPTKFKAKLEAEQAKKELAAKKLAEEEKMLVEIMPGLKVKKVEVVR